MDSVVFIFYLTQYRLDEQPINFQCEYRLPHSLTLWHKISPHRHWLLPCLISLLIDNCQLSCLHDSFYYESNSLLLHKSLLSPRLGIEKVWFSLELHFLGWCLVLLKSITNMCWPLNEAMINEEMAHSVSSLSHWFYFNEWSLRIIVWASVNCNKRRAS